MAGRSAWTRIWAVSRRQGVEEGLRARVADPCWMLARQWQFGAFRGDDAASPVRIEVHHRSHDLGEIQGGAGDWTTIETHQPPEVMFEPFDPRRRASAMRHSYEAGLQFLRYFPPEARAGLAEFLRGLLSEPEDPDDFDDPSGLLRLLMARGFAGAKLAARDKALDGDLAEAAPTDSTATLEALTAWRAYYAERFARRETQPAWRGERQAYNFSLRTQEADARRITLKAPRHDGDTLDWMSVDLAGEASPAADKDFGKDRTDSLFPIPIRYSGMPAERFWDMEEGRVNFGGLSARNTDLAQMVLTEFATVYSNDWFLVPTRARAGTVTRIGTITVWDTFGKDHVVQALRVNERDTPGWKFFELTGDPSASASKTPWLYIPRTLVGADRGNPLEEVIFSRDEMANLAWGIETRVTRADGSGFDRAQAWQRLRGTGDAPREARPGPDDPWRYTLVTPVPPHWVPFIPEVKEKLSTGRLMRARLQDWDLLDEEIKRRFAGAQGPLMEPERPFAIRDEEIPSGGISVIERFETARGADGKRYVWLARRRRPAVPVPGSGRKTDHTETGGSSE